MRVKAAALVFLQLIEFVKRRVVILEKEVISSVCSLVSAVIVATMTNRVTVYRIGQLERKVDKHNNLIERTYAIEKRLDVDEEKIRVANDRLRDIEEDMR